MEKWEHFHTSKRYNWYVSNHGRIRKVGIKNEDYNRIIELSVSGGHPNSRYYCLSMNDMPEKYLHRLVAKMFVPNPYNKQTVNHIDGDKLNNYVDNLEWATYSENIKHSYFNGSRKSKAVTPEAKVKAFQLRSEGLTYRKIGDILGYSHTAVRKMVIEFKIF